MIPTSIRWRLPLTYAAIALLTVAALGVVLLTTLCAYYSERESDFLNRNARVIAEGVERMLANGAPLTIVRAQLENFAFLSQSHIRLLGAQEQVLAESSIPGDFLISLAYTALPAPRAIWQEPAGMILLEGDTSVVAEAGATPVSPVPPDTQTSEDVTLQYVPMMGIEQDRRYWIHVSQDETAPARDFFVSMPVAGTPFGLDLNRRMPFNGPRSDQAVRIALSGQDEPLSGYVELSKGPAYGTEIVQSVLQALVAAGLVAVVVAGGTGWYVSRRMTAPLLALTDATARMAEGHLSARAEFEGEDEFGLLGHSFNQMAARVESTVSTLRRFVADAAHELHTPLTALHANLELAATEQSDAQRLTFIERAVEQLKRLETLTSGLLDLSRIETRSDPGEWTSIDLVAMVKETSELYASRAEQASHWFYMDLPDAPVVATANEAQLRCALGNLLDNAIKFTPPNGTIGVGLARRDGQIELWVKDTGIGIPAEDLPQLFSRFHRARNTASYPGSGLGLAIIKAIVEGHSGQVSVNSGAHGTCFTLQLPLAP